MEPQITLEIDSPQAQLVKTKVVSVMLPGEMGRFEVLKDHAPILSALVPGQIRYVDAEGEKSIDISCGFVEVLNNVVSVCVEL